MKKILKLLFPAILAMSVVFGCGNGSPDGPGNGSGNSLFPKGKVVCDGKGVAGVVVTDGKYFTQTKQDGSFELPYNDQARFVYISSPSGYTVDVKASVPQFWTRLEGSDRNDLQFELTETGNDDKHWFVGVGDPQIRNATEAAKLGIRLADLKKDIDAIETPLPVHVMVAGDIVFNTPNMNDRSKLEFQKLGQPVYYSIGNHDHTLTAGAPNIENDKTADKEYEKHYGPRFYSFNRGKVHYIAFDNIEFKGGEDTYNVAITKEQMDWIAGDLKYVPKSNAVVLLAHAPTQSRNGGVQAYAAELHRLVQGYANVQIVTGHTHYNAVAIAGGRTEHIVGAICGGFWESTVCLDGSVLGYKIFEVDGTDFKWEYIAAGKRNTCFSYFRNHEIPAAIRRGNEVLINVWDWDPAWKVECSEDNGATYVDMVRSESRSNKDYDPVAYRDFGITANDGIPAGRQWIKAGTTDHLFYHIPQNGTAKVKVRVTTRFGKVYEEDITL